MRRDSKGASDSHGTDDDGRRPVGRRAFLGAAGAAGVAGLAGCSGGSNAGNGSTSSGDGTTGTGTTATTASGTPTMGGTLQWGGAVPVQSLDPHLESAAASQRVLENIVEELVQLQPDYSLKPHLAKTLKTSDDKKTLSMTLQQGVKFHDGTEMTSADVKASYDRVANGDYLATGFFKFVDSMEAPDDYSFDIHLNKPFAPFIARMATSELAIVPESQAKQQKIKTPVGTGPYQYESREIDTSFTMTKFGDYWNASDQNGPFLDKVVKTEIKDSTTRLQSLQTGEFDFINGVAPKDVQTLKSASQVRLETQFPKSLVYLGMNCAEKPFDDKDARLALDYALDKEKIMQAALYGTGKTTASPAAPGSPWVNPDVKPRPRDLDKAKSHLEKAGMADGFTVSFKVPKSYPTQVQGAKVIADQASDAGIDMQIQQITWSSWLSDVYTKKNFQATTSSYLALWYPDVSFYKFLDPNGAFFFTGWNNSQYNRLVEKARHLYDQQERADLYHQATQILQDDRSGHLLLWWQPDLYGASQKYKGHMGTADGSTLWFADNYLDQ